VIDRACSTYGREDEWMQAFGGKTRREEISGKEILKWILEK
jgi:hypothetical protein